MLRNWLGVAALLALTSSATAAQTPSHSADDEVARNLFQAGKTAYEAGNYEDALSFFEQSHARSHRPQLLYNIGQAADRMRDDQKALTSFKAYLAALPNAENRAEVENRIRALERTSNPYTVPSPRETAQAATSAEPSTSATTASDSEPVTGKWWFWTAVGGGVALVALSAIVLSSGDTRQAPIESTTGVTVMTLGGSR